MLFTVLLAGEETTRQPAPLVLIAPHADGTSQACDVNSVIAEADQPLRTGAEEPRSAGLHGEDGCRGIELA